MSEKDTRTKDALYAPLTVDSRQGRGGTYGYVKWQNVADRMNEVFGMLWSSSVVSQEIIGENLIVRVSVCAKDPISGEIFCQEGYGGSQMRAGDEAGTAHKGAYSKGFRDACKKWGVALHLEEGEASSKPAASSPPPGFMGKETAPAPSAPSMAPPGPSMPSTPAPKLAVVPDTVAKDSGYEMPSPVQPGGGGQALAVADNAPVMPSTMAPPDMTPPTNPPAPSMAPPTPGPAPSMAPPAPKEEVSADTPGTINNVQEMAIKNLARLSGLESPEQLLGELINTPEVGLTREIKNMNDLSYTEAVNVIKAAKNLNG